MLVFGSSAWPGQSGNPVGHTAAPGYPGSLTTWPGGSFVNGTTYSFIDFNTGNHPNITIGSGVSNVTFFGCRFQSNANSPHPAASSSSNVLLNGTNIIFQYCSFTPLISKYSQVPNYGLNVVAWPASGALHNVTAQVGGIPSNSLANAVEETDAYTYGVAILSGGPVSFSKCDFWGYGNIAIDFTSTTTPMLVDSCWLHDSAAHGSTNNEHLDAIGYLNDLAVPSNITISNCTIATIGNNGSGDGLAWQGGTGNCNNVNHIHNYIGGYGYTIILGGGTLGGVFTNSQFINNVIGTDVQSYWGFLFQGNGINDYSTMFSTNGNLWRGNTINVVPGTTYSSTSDTRAHFTSANNGQFFLPNGTFSDTDFTG